MPKSVQHPVPQPGGSYPRIRLTERRKESLLSSPSDLAAVERWTSEHPRFPELLDVVDAEQQTRYLTFMGEWHISSHVLVALRANDIIGFLRFAVQPIGPDNDLPAVQLNNHDLTEAKILAFGVISAARKQGVGKQLQQATLEWARELGCYQVRSHSDGESQANHQLKLSMGFAFHPTLRGEDKRGAYFIMPLHSRT